jgi:putative endonuclease
MWSVYIVKCADNTLYTGIAKNVEARLTQHNEGSGARYTRSRRPVKLVFHERASDRGDALRREMAIKQMRASDKLALIKSGTLTR